MEEDVDPAWWEAVSEPAGEGDATRAPEMLWFTLAELARAAEQGTLRHRVLEALAVASSAMLEPDDWNEPFKPSMQFGDRRSPVPSDLLPEQVALLADVAARISHPAFRARVADVAWTYGERSRVDLLDVAIDAYRAAVSSCGCTSSSQ